MPTEVNLQAISTPFGQFVLYDAPAYAAADKPVALLLHGALGAAGALAGCLAPFAAAFEPILADLPGHGRAAPPPAPDVESYGRGVAMIVAQRFAGRPVVLVGESFGGLTALAAAAHCRAAGVVAVDPPLSSAKQWHVRDAFQAFLRERPNTFAREFGWRVFGVREGRADIEQRLYYPLLDRLPGQTLLLTGDAPLGPPHPSAMAPCCLDEVDAFILDRMYADRVRWSRLSNVGHVALRDRPDACFEAVAAYMRDQHAFGGHTPNKETPP